MEKDQLEVLMKLAEENFELAYNQGVVDTILGIFDLQDDKVVLSKAVLSKLSEVLIEERSKTKTAEYEATRQLLFMEYGKV